MGPSNSKYNVPCNGCKIMAINADGTLRDTTYSYTRITDSTPLPKPEGPDTYEALIETLVYLQANKIEPFLLFKSIWTDGGTIIGWDRNEETMTDKTRDFRTPFGVNYNPFEGAWWPLVPNITIVEPGGTGDKLDYICLGDSASWDGMKFTAYGLQQRDGPITQNYINDGLWLFAHKKIVQRFPGRDQMGKAFRVADTASATGDLASLYHGLGVSTIENPVPAVLKAFLKLTMTPSNTGNWTGLDISVPVCHESNCLVCSTRLANGTAFKNACAITPQSNFGPTHAVLLPTIEQALENLAECVIYKSSDVNAIFQGLMMAENKQLRKDVSLRLMKALCNSDLEIPKYPKVCACIGRKGVEDALRKEVDNELVRMVCQSSDCLNGDRTGDVFTFEPSPPCAPINICKPGLDVNAAKTTMSNVTFNCNFDKGSGTTPTSQDMSNAPSAAPSATTGLSKKNKIIIGASAGAGLVIIVIVVIIALKRRKAKQ